MKKSLFQFLEPLQRPAVLGFVFASTVIVAGLMTVLQFHFKKGEFAVAASATSPRLSSGEAIVQGKGDSVLNGLASFGQSADAFIENPDLSTAERAVADMEKVGECLCTSVSSKSTKGDIEVREFVSKLEVFQMHLQNFRNSSQSSDPARVEAACKQVESYLSRIQQLNASSGPENSPRVLASTFGH